MVCFLLTSCTQEELSSSSVVDRLRVLAVRPEPAEASPGETITFEALILSPKSEISAVLWLACLADETGVTGCEFSEETLDAFEDIEDPENLTPEQIAELYEELVDAGLIGVEPWLSPTYTVPDNLLDGLSEDEQLEGLSLFVQVTAIPEEGEDPELAYKRVPISLAVTPNNNPDIINMLVDGIEIEKNSTIIVDAGQKYSFEPILESSSIEEYQYKTSNGIWETRTEEPYFSWYRQEGDFNGSTSLYPYSGVEWTAPEKPTFDEQFIWVIVQDRRGGMGWWTQKVLVK